MRRWRCGHEWPLMVEEGERGWSLYPAPGIRGEEEVPDRWRDSSGAFGAPSEEYGLDGQTGRWRLRVYPRERVLAAGAVPQGNLDVPPGWWSSLETDAELPWGCGPQGTSLDDLVRCERRGWGDSELGGLHLVENWHRTDPSHGDTEVLHRLVWVGKCLPRGDDSVVLDCRGWLRKGDSERDLADAFLYLHQTHRVRWLALDAFPDPEVVRALERAHGDSQGDLHAVWLGAPLQDRRTEWMRLGPWLPDLPRLDRV